MHFLPIIHDSLRHILSLSLALCIGLIVKSQEIDQETPSNIKVSSDINFNISGNQLSSKLQHLQEKDLSRININCESVDVIYSKEIRKKENSLSDCKRYVVPFTLNKDTADIAFDWNQGFKAWWQVALEYEHGGSEVEVSSDKIRQAGTQSIKFFVDAGQDLSDKNKFPGTFHNTNQRAEISTRENYQVLGAKEDSVVFIGWSEIWPQIDYEESTYTLQLRSQPEGVTGGPAIGLFIEEGKLKLIRKWNEEIVLIDKMRENVWYDFVLEIKYSKKDEGYVKVWVYRPDQRNSLTYSYSDTPTGVILGPNMHNPITLPNNWEPGNISIEDDSPHIRWGVYRPNARRAFEMDRGVSESNRYVYKYLGPTRITIGDKREKGFESVKPIGYLPDQEINMNCFSDKNGIIAIEAENYSIKYGSVNNNRESHWEISSDEKASSGKMLTSLSTDNLTVNTETMSPQVDYLVDFSQPGTYFLWVRSMGTDWYSDTYFVGINGDNIVPESGMGYFRSEWNWFGKVLSYPVKFEIPEAGKYVIHIWPRESGVKVDKILITRNFQYLPAGLGPAESLKCSVESNPIATIKDSIGSDTLDYEDNLIDHNTFDHKQGSNRLTSIYPNPLSSREKITVSYQNTDKNMLEVEIFDVSGKLRHQTQHILKEGKNMISLPTDELDSGVYVLRLSDGTHRYFRNVYISN